MTDVWNYWYFHIPNFILAALFYTLIGRLVLGMFVPEDWNNYLWRAFRRLTDPVVFAVRWITPSTLPRTVVMLFALLWLMAARVVLALSLDAFGLLPPAPLTGA